VLVAVTGETVADTVADFDLLATVDAVAGVAGIEGHHATVSAPGTVARVAPPSSRPVELGP
jgi:hypothetical protein